MEDVDSESLRPLPVQFSNLKLEPQASEAKLAYLEIPFDDEEYGELAYSEFSNLVQGVELLGNVIQVEKTGKIHLMLYQKPKQDYGRLISVNEILTRKGLAYIPEKVQNNIRAMQISKIKSLNLNDSKTSAAKSELDWVVDAEDDAKKQRVNIWRYGDYSNRKEDE